MSDWPSVGDAGERDLRAVGREGGIGDLDERCAARRVHVELLAPPELDAWRPPLLHLVAEALDVELVPDPVLRGEREDPVPEPDDAVLDGMEGLEAGYAVRDELDGAPRVAHVDEVESRAAAPPIDAAEQHEVPVRRGDEVLRLGRELAQLPELREVLLRLQVLRVVAALEPRAPARVDLLDRLVQHAAHEPAEVPRRAAARRASAEAAPGVAGQVRVLEECLDLLDAVLIGDEGDARLAELVGRDVPADAVLPERQHVVAPARIGVPDEVAQVEVRLDVDSTLRVELGDPLDEPEREERDRRAHLLRAGGLEQLLDGELVHHLVRRDLDEARMVAEVRDRHLEVLG